MNALDTRKSLSRRVARELMSNESMKLYLGLLLLTLNHGGGIAIVICRLYIWSYFRGQRVDPTAGGFFERTLPELHLNRNCFFNRGTIMDRRIIGLPATVD